MNEVLKAIEARRSIRAYKPEQIKDEELNEILRAGNLAPSAMNQKPWNFTVVQNKELIGKLNDFCKKAMQRDNNKDLDLFYNAPTLIVVSSDAKAIAPEIDGALALGNMFLAAESLGIGSCWIHAVKALYTTEEGKELIKELNLPEGYSIIGSGVFGYKVAPANTPRKEGTVNIIK
ncbi:nitroreductase family protein [Clostridium sp. 'White wine YQ']|uniref:nitroreductase family protein n=1 Tax=Clostridium sp. 'White wine YQ' TaxID=3027474 RepID=UPI00236724CF|nr:nitroreductase [Clostridium sp. 'White wine YQ']MDD7795227.1 nitroreductase [Clostridium sp. 'White wine YQ']